jgi:hypothetical protein
LGGSAAFAAGVKFGEPKVHDVGFPDGDAVGVDAAANRRAENVQACVSNVVSLPIET